MLCISDSFTRGEVLPKVYFVIHLRTLPLRVYNVEGNIFLKLSIHFVR